MHYATLVFDKHINPSLITPLPKTYPSFKSQQSGITTFNDIFFTVPVRLLCQWSPTLYKNFNLSCP